jgi:hypothetical protein
MGNTQHIKNDSIVLNDVLSERCNADRIDLLDAKSHSEITFILKDGMIQDYRIHKKRRVKR